MNQNQQALLTIAKYLATHCEPIANSDEKVEIVHTEDYTFEINFRKYSYHDYYDEDKYHHLRCSEDLEAKVRSCMSTLPPNYQHPNLRYGYEVGDKGRCYVSVYLAQPSCNYRY